MYNIGYTLDELISNIGDYNIYAYYLGTSFKVGCPMHSPLRSKDNNPSFCIFYSSKNNKLLYKDFGTGDSGDCIQFVKNYYRLNSSKEAKFKIITELSNNIPHVGKSFKFEPILAEEKTKFTLEEQSFTTYDLKYWNSYCVSIPTLNKYRVVSVAKLYVKDILLWTYSPENPIFGYKIKDSIKCYRPFGGKGYKFRTNCSIYDIQGIEQLPKKSDLLIITKSMKDVMVLYELGYISIAPNSEGASIPTDIMLDLKERFTNIIILYDNDKAGIQTSTKLASIYNLKCIYIPTEYKCKDVSDLVYTNQNTDKTKEIIKQLINEY